MAINLQSTLIICGSSNVIKTYTSYIINAPLQAHKFDVNLTYEL